MVISDNQVQEQAFAFVAALRVLAALTCAFAELNHAVPILNQSKNTIRRDRFGACRLEVLND